MPDNPPGASPNPDQDAGSVPVVRSPRAALPLLPDDLSAITFDDIVALVDRVDYEPGPVDFKATLNPKGPNSDQARSSIRRAAAAMANTEGGWILFGILDRQSLPAHARQRIIGIPLGGDIRKELGDKLEPIAPHIRFDVATVELTPGAGSGVLIARIPLSALRPHMLDKLFYRRGEGGNAQPMDYFEVRDQMMLTQDREQRVRLLRLELSMFQQIGGMIASNMAPDTRPILSMHRFDTSGFKALLADIVGVLPDDTALMRLLLMIPIHATELNNTLDWAQGPAWIYRIMAQTMDQTTASLVGDYERRLLSNTQMLKEVCQQVEAQLAVEFGPVPFN